MKRTLKAIKPKLTNPIAWDINDAAPCTLHVQAGCRWVLTGLESGTQKPVNIPLNPGEYSLAFVPNSPGLSLLIIDPDPGIPPRRYP